MSLAICPLAQPIFYLFLRRSSSDLPATLCVRRSRRVIATPTHARPAVAYGVAVVFHLIPLRNPSEPWKGNARIIGAGGSAQELFDWHDYKAAIVRPVQTNQPLSCLAMISQPVAQESLSSSILQIISAWGNLLFTLHRRVPSQPSHGLPLKSTVVGSVFVDW